MKVLIYGILKINLHDLRNYASASRFDDFFSTKHVMWIGWSAGIGWVLCLVPPFGIYRLYSYYSLRVTPT